jgi:hypothetical protein
VSAALSGDNTLLAATANTRYLIRRMFLSAAAGVSILFKSGSNNLTGAIPLVANEKVQLDEPYPNIEPWLTTNTNEAFILNLSGAVAVTGWLIYDTQPQT